MTDKLRARLYWAIVGTAALAILAAPAHARSSRGSHVVVDPIGPRAIWHKTGPAYDAHGHTVPAPNIMPASGWSPELARAMAAPAGSNLRYRGDLCMYLVGHDAQRACLGYRPGGDSAVPAVSPRITPSVPFVPTQSQHVATLAPSADQAMIAWNGRAFATTVRLGAVSAPAIVDTGATMVGLCTSTLQQAGWRVPADAHRVRLNTANGTAEGWRINLPSLDVAGVRLDNVAAIVRNSASDCTIMVGVSFLARLRSVEMRGQSLTLHK